jgi:hypothetical protein
MNQGKGQISIILGVLAIILVVGMFFYFDSRVKKLEEVITPSSATGGTSTPVVPGEEIKKEEFVEPEEVPEESWKAVTSFNGKGSQKTDAFSISANQWRIKWEVSLLSGKTGKFLLKVIHANNNQIETTVDFQPSEVKTENYSEYIYINKGQDDFYLDIEAENIQSWKIEVGTL